MPEGKILKADDLVSALARLRRQAGLPSARMLSERTRSAVSHTTISALFNGTHVPAWPRVVKVIEAMGGRATDFEQHWQAAWDRHCQRRDADAPQWQHMQIDAPTSKIAEIADDHAPHGWELRHVVGLGDGRVTLVLRRVRPARETDTDSGPGPAGQ